MDVEKIFNNLESNQTQECEEAKKKLVEMFSQNKEQWLVQYLMDYFLRTGSSRIMEVLVKVQAPHDIYILDRLADWLKNQTHRVHALNIFFFVVRKHPTWLFKVEKHRLKREIFNLLLNEREIVPLMTALLCIITLLPLIPNSVPNFLNDLFDVFAHLISWNSQKPNRLSDVKLVHLQLGLQMLFHRLYGMYPCNFLRYLRDFIKKEDGAIYYHTIKPLLETVRVHPLLVTATEESEVTNSRWKEVEPHDVVVDCARLSLPFVNQDFSSEQMHQLSTTDLLYTPNFVPHTPRITTGSSTSIYYAYQIRDVQRRPITRFDGGANSSSSTSAIWSPYNEITASGPIPVTPTPSYRLPTSNAVVSNLNTELLGVTGSSPPEAAVEATPETTPMKDMREVKNVGGSAVTIPHAVRAIFPPSQPSSPLRREHNQFNFPEVLPEDKNLTRHTAVEEEQSTPILRVTSTYDRKLQQMVHDRNHSRSPFQTSEIMDSNLRCNTSDNDLDTVNTAALPASSATPIPPLIEHITKTCDDCNETDRSMCTAGGLHMPNSRSWQLLAKGLKKRTRMYSYCYNDSSCEKFNGNCVDPEDDSVKVRRTKSCSSMFDGVESPKEPTTQKKTERCRLQKSSKMLAIATATKKAVTTSYTNVACQTVDTLTENYEHSLFAMLLESNNFRTSTNQMCGPQKILDQYSTLPKDVDQELFHLLNLELHYERYRREIHSERNRRLMGRSRDKRSLEMERDRLREQLQNFAAQNSNLERKIETVQKVANERQQSHTRESVTLKTKYQSELEQNKILRQANENLQARLNEELAKRKEVNAEMEALRGQIFDMKTELQHAKVQVDLGQQYKQELARLEAEFIVMGEVQVKCRDRLLELDNSRARQDELQMMQNSYYNELKELKHHLAEKIGQLDGAKHKIMELQAQVVNSEKVITEEKRLLKAVKDEYEEKFKTLNKKYDVQKITITQMEEKYMMLLHKPQTRTAHNACSPDTDIASSMEHNSPLSASLASSESLSASLRSTELRNLHHLVEAPVLEASSSSGLSVVATGASIIEGTRMPALDLASSANTVAGTSILSGPSAMNIMPISVTHSYNMASSTSGVHTHPHLHLHQQQQQKR